MSSTSSGFWNAFQVNTNQRLIYRFEMLYTKKCKDTEYG